MLTNEIFLSCQGEGVDAGIPTVFVRFQKCNVACRWCDTKYALGEGGEELTVDEIVARVVNADKYNCNRVYLTGGEPLIRDISALVTNLKKIGYSITVATNGTLPRPSWWKKVLWDVDCKCTSSGVSVFDWSWSTIGRKNRIKFVVQDKDDLKFVIGMLPDLYGPLCSTILVSPVILPGWFPDREKGCLIVGDRVEDWLQTVWGFCIKYQLRYSLQVHKVVWGMKKGV